MQSLGQSVQSMSVANQKLVELQRIMSLMAMNESSVRSFVITGDSTYIKKRFYPKHQLKPSITRLRELENMDHLDVVLVDSLDLMIDRRFDYLHLTLYKYKQNPNDQNVMKDHLLISDGLSDLIRTYVAECTEKEKRNVNVYEINHKYEIETSILTSFLLVTIALFILLLSLSRVNSDLVSLKKLNDELKFMNYTFNSAEKIAGISHWKYNLSKNTYSFSENFFNLLGISEDPTDFTMEKYLSYIHPDDREGVAAAYSDSLLHRTPTSLVFRVNKLGEWRFIRSVSSFAENSRQEYIKIGVNYDITDHYKNTAELEENNRWLKTTNAELESFNNIVSHDLQEPLRKIQMFISRLGENEIDSMSETGQKYFERIASSANRMQNLLIDLVNYSRTIKGDKAFVQTDLNAVVADVINELSLNIEEAGAEVLVGNLPSAKVIPLQIHQLFINLLSNALKFRNRGSQAIIRISHEAIKSVDIRGNLEFKKGRYIKLVVQDNGVGFKQEFAEQIFQLFRRLEKESYEGTGIGLAICKKIVENHNGHIFAESAPGEGTKFYIYLMNRD
jgi:signal transduction histidine kinase/CHASE3 domain sensor protein